MSKWKCEICGSEFDNFHAQGFNNKIYCPLCFFKEENQQLKEQLEEEIGNEFKLKDELRKNRKEYQETYKDVREEIKVYKLQLQQRDSVIEEALYYISNYTSKSEVNISGLPKCNIFKGSIDELLDILNKYKKEESR